MTIRHADAIRQSLSQVTLESLANLETFREIGSTNTYLLAADHPSPGMMRVAIAAQQTAGRGRRGRTWYSPAGAGLWMSVAYTFMARPTNLPALTLAVGATLADELTALGVENIALKWPNDLLVDDRKLGGILLESCAGGMTAIAGIGINIALPEDANNRVMADKEPIDLRALLPVVPAVDLLAARVVEGLRMMLQEYDCDGFESFAAGWSKRDALIGRRIVVRQPDNQETGIARGIAQGIASDGALLLRDEDGLQHIVSGSVNMADLEEALA